MDIGNLIVKLGLDKSEYDKNLNAAKASTAQSTKSMQDSFLDGAKSIGITLGATIAVATTAYKTIIEPTVEFNKQIRTQKQLTGLAAEELSRITQVGDDWGISAEGMTSIMQGLAKKGFKPSIDNLAKLADEYVNATDKTKFMEEASKKYGKQFQNLLPLLAQGGQSLREQAAAQNENQLATEKSIEQSRRFEVAVDNLTDKWQGLVFTVGNAVIPALADYLTPTVQTTIDGVNLLTREVDGQIRYFERHGQILVDVTNKYRGVGSAAEKFAKEDLVVLNEGLGNTTDAAGELDKSLDTIVVDLINLDRAYLARDAIDAVNKAMENGAFKDVFYYHQALLDVGKDFSDVIPRGQVAASIALADLKDQLATDKITWEEYVALAQSLDRTIRGLPHDTAVNITVTTTYKTVGEEPDLGEGAQEKKTRGTKKKKGGGGARKGKQFGTDMIIPPGYPNDSYPVGLTSGERLIVLTPNQQQKQSITNNWNLNITSNARTENLISDFGILKAFAGV